MVPSSSQPSPDFGPCSFTQRVVSVLRWGDPARRRTAPLPGHPGLSLRPILGSPGGSPQERQSKKHFCVLVIPWTFALTILPGPLWLCCHPAARLLPPAPAAACPKPGPWPEKPRDQGVVATGDCVTGIES